MLTIAVLAGGISLEREVSLASGNHLVQALKSDGIDTVLWDADERLAERLRSVQPTAVINLLHGQRGEDGTISELLTLLGIRYIGQPPSAARMAYHKPTAKAMATLCGIPTPENAVLPLEVFREYGAKLIMELIIDRINLPMVVKPARGGSGIGLTIVQEASGLSRAFMDAFACDSSVMAERYIPGSQIAVTIVDDRREARVLPVVQVESKSGQYDYAARYSPGESFYTIPPAVPPAYIDAATAAALKIHRHLGMRHVTRTDFVLGEDGSLQFIEITGSPGLTETSPTTAAISASDIHLSATYINLVEALTRSDAQGSASPLSP